jgi:hypothetical protein|tara:strand:+ start:1013 stop:1594 length:582 start_codon:yes stop_codon:yes gene_type:complete
MKELNLKLAEIQTKLKAKKSSYNSFGKYHFRKAEDILEAIKPFLLQHSVSVTINEELIQDTNVPIIKSTAIITDGKDSVQATAIVGVDLGQKGMQTAQQFGAASSYGKKYALGNLFLIDDTQDSDATNNHGKSKAVSKIKQAAKPEITRNQLNKAVEYVKSGGDIEAIKAKYKITTDQENYLNEQTADNKETL